MVDAEWRCTALRADGTVCGEPATVVDLVRQAMVCPEHMTGAEQQAKMGQVTPKPHTSGELGLVATQSRTFMEAPQQKTAIPTMQPNSQDYSNPAHMLEIGREIGRQESEMKHANLTIWIILVITVGPTLLWTINQCIRVILR